MNPEKEQKKAAEAGELLGCFTAQGWQSKITAESNIQNIDMRLCERCDKIFPAWTEDPKPEPLLCANCYAEETEDLLNKVSLLRGTIGKIWRIALLPVETEANKKSSGLAAYACGAVHALASAAIDVKMGWE